MTDDPELKRAYERITELEATLAPFADAFKRSLLAKQEKDWDIHPGEYTLMSDWNAAVYRLHGDWKS